MYAVGYTLDNLSLMGLTIAVCFVVDDAIVMLENIYRHMEEEGLGAFEAALKGSREIGFTIVSITVSLVAVFIPVLLMGGVIGRLFNEFAVVVTASIAACCSCSRAYCGQFLWEFRPAPSSSPDTAGARWICTVRRPDFTSVASRSSSAAIIAVHNCAAT